MATTQQQATLDWFREHPGSHTINNVCGAFDRAYSTVRIMLVRLHRLGLLDRTYINPAWENGPDGLHHVVGHFVYFHKEV